MAGMEGLSERDKAVLKSIFDPTVTIAADVNDDGDSFPAEDEPTPESHKESIAHCARGVQLAEAGNLEEALKMMNEGVSAAPERAEAYNDRAQLYRLMQRDDDAMADIDRAIELTPCKARALALCQRGVLLRKRKQDDDTRAAFQQAAALGSGFAKKQRGVLLRKRKQDDDARAAFKQAAALGSGFAKKQMVELNPYAALCNQMLSQVMRGEKEIKL
ncbi:hypothetical protein NE865_01572 [Phthorimaea operculella]|nr:hypothetical protein NE865_01572 [Phthorimaea operculella]